MHPTEFEINAFVDGSPNADRAEAIRRHVEECRACHALVSDLREIRRAAAALRAVDPPASVWSRIDRAIRDEADAGGESSPATAPGPVSQVDDIHVHGPRSSRWLWLATAAALVMAIGLAARMGYLPHGRSTTAGSEEVPPAPSIEAELSQGEQHYQQAILGLEQIATAQSGNLDADTAATLQVNLAVVDRAIDESRAALRAQPGSEPAQQSLLDSFKAKVGLLQETIGLINELRKGTEAVGTRTSGLKRGI